MQLLDPASYLHKLYGNHMASDKTLICGLGGNTKTTEPMKCFIFTDTRFYHERPR